jgi:hypothetical protein
MSNGLHVSRLTTLACCVLAQIGAGSWTPDPLFGCSGAAQYGKSASPHFSYRLDELKANGSNGPFWLRQWGVATPTSPGLHSGSVAVAGVELCYLATFPDKVLR